MLLWRALTMRDVEVDLLVGLLGKGVYYAAMEQRGLLVPLGVGGGMFGGWVWFS
jgi:hypothetical protein